MSLKSSDVPQADVPGANLLQAETRTALPPKIPAPANARQVLVILRLSAKDPAAFHGHLLKVIPVTRLASGCRYSHTYQDPIVPGEFALVQGWDSVDQQQGYIRWRESTGDLAELISFLSKPPVVETFSLLDA